MVERLFFVSTLGVSLTAISGSEILELLVLQASKGFWPWSFEYSVTLERTYFLKEADSDLSNFSE